MQQYTVDNKKAVEAKLEAQKIAFGPFVFQAAKSLRDMGILKTVFESKNTGLTLEEIQKNTDVSLYGVKVLVEAGLGMGLFLLNENKYTLTKTGYFLLADEMTRVNMDFMHDICYEGAFKLDESIKQGKPAGLDVFGEWNTIYEALSTLPEKAKKSWFDFDQYYSDQAFDEVLLIIFKHKPGKLMDIGENTGKWTLKSLGYSDTIKVTMLDLPNQLKMAKGNIEKAGHLDRVTFQPLNILDRSQNFPENQDIIWMSQFLDCFSMDEIVSILSRAAKALAPNGRICILETYWNRQKYEASAFCLQQISLYFTCMANGNSQMYHSGDMIQCLNKAGLILEEDIDNIGISHTLFICKKA